MMDYHQTDTDGFYVGTFPADESPLEAGVFHIPGGAVIGAAPPALAANQCARWNGAAWDVLPDFRGSVYFLADHSRHEITTRGVALPAGALAADPAPTQAELDKAVSDAAKAALVQIDIASIRSIREWITAQPNPPAILVQHNTDAATQRAKVKP